MLDAAEAYKAGGQNFDTAAARAKHAVEAKLIPESEREAFFIRELTHLAEQRVERGEFASSEVEVLR